MKNQRAKFSLPKSTTYLNCAYMSPLMKRVEKAGLAGMVQKRNPMKVSVDDFFRDTESLRREFARLINLGDPRRVVVIPSASYGLSTVARNTVLRKGDSVVVMHEQFPSNVYPWMRLTEETGAKLKIVEPPTSLVDRGKIWNERLVDAIQPGTRVVALGNVHWADGTRFDLAAVSRRAREVGARLVVDGTQSIGALPFDQSTILADAVICAGYKWLMGPYSIGLAYYGEAYDKGVPLEENWINRLGSEDFSGLVKYEQQYQPGALRYEVGEHSNFILVPMMLEALRQVNAWGPKNVQVYCRSITSKGIARLQDHGYWIENESWRGQHLFGIRFPKNSDVVKIRERVKRKGISISFRGDFMRISPHVYNSESDFMKLVEVLTSKP